MLPMEMCDTVMKDESAESGYRDIFGYRWVTNDLAKSHFAMAAWTEGDSDERIYSIVAARSFAFCKRSSGLQA